MSPMTLSSSEQTAIRHAQNFWKVMFKESLSMAKFILLIKEDRGQGCDRDLRQSALTADIQQDATTSLLT